MGDDYERVLLLVTAVYDALHDLGIERVPSGDAVRAALDRHARNRAIAAAFTGRNYRELAEQHGLSVRSVRRIVERARRDAARKGPR